jgi:hypothetical protein
MAGLVALPLAAQDTGQASGDDMFNTPESVTQTTDQTQNAAPRDALLKETVPRITGTFTSKITASWFWNDVWNKAFDLFQFSSSSLNQLQTGIALGFIARPDTDISITGQVRTYYPFTQQITALTSATYIPLTTVVTTSSTFTAADITIWSLYSKFTYGDSLFLTFGKQPIKWGTGYFFSPADDVFAQSAVDVTDPTAEREGPLALKVQYPIPGTMDNLYFFTAMPASNNPTTVANMKPSDVAVAAKAEFLFGNTEVAAAGFYQGSVRPQAILMATTGTNNFNFFGEGVAAFADPSADPYLQKSSGGVYSTADRAADTLYSGTVGMMYSNQDWNFTFVTQYLYNGMGYDSITLGDLYPAVLAGALSYSDVVSNFAGLGKIGKHYGVMFASWTELFNTKLDVSILALANFSDGSGYINPTITLTTLTYVKISGGVSVSWGAPGTEFANPSGYTSIADTVNATPTLAFILGLSFGTQSF